MQLSAPPPGGRLRAAARDAREDPGGQGFREEDARPLGGPGRVAVVRTVLSDEEVVLVRIRLVYLKQQCYMFFFKIKHDQMNF